MPAARFAATFLLIALLPFPAKAQWWNTMAPPNAIQPGSGSDAVIGRYLVDDAAAVVIQAMRQMDFEKLDRMHDEFVGGRVRARDGSWLVQSFEIAVEAYFRGASPDEYLPMFAAWKAARPTSAARPSMEAAMWQMQAWTARGNARAPGVSPEDMITFQSRIARAQAVLDGSRATGATSPIWHWVALIAAGSAGKSAAEQDAVLARAVKVFPDYLPHYLTRVNYLLPQWGGSWQLVDQFVLRATAETAAQNGKAFYAWIYTDIVRKTSADFFVETRVRWPEMQASFEDMIGRFPDNWNKNLYLAMSCKSGDARTAARLLAELGKRANPWHLVRGVTLESCRELAASVR